jgi:serine/threonine protein phosphatase PrpC
MTIYKIEAGTAQHLGDRPQQNDRAALFTGALAPGFVMAVVADGLINGVAAEQVLLTAKQLFDEFKPGDNPTVERIEAMLRAIVAEAHLISKMNSVRAKCEQVSSAAMLVLTPQGRAVWAHVGDTRLYRFRGAECGARTNDAAFVEHLIANEKLDPESAKNHRRSPLHYNVIGNKLREPFVTVDSFEALAGGDNFLIATDGLWHYFADAEFAAVMTKNTPRQAAELLMKKAGERAKGKRDNCTMAIIRLVDPPKEEPGIVKVQKLKRAV